MKVRVSVTPQAESKLSYADLYKLVSEYGGANINGQRYINMLYCDIEVAQAHKLADTGKVAVADIRGMKMRR